MKRNAVFLMACLMLTLSIGLAAQTPSSEPQTECEKALTELEQTCLDELTRLESEYDARLMQQGLDCEAAIRKAAADVAKPLLVEIAGLRAERNAAARQRVWWGLGGIGVGLVAGILIGILGG